MGVSAKPQKVAVVVGARPNFMKMGPVMAALKQHPDSFDPLLVHTGQHYDATMSKVFLEELGIGDPDYSLGAGQGGDGNQTVRIMERLRPVFERERPDLILVPGDVTSTLAAALVAVDMGITLGHVEAGLRSFDDGMPEEWNRVLTDSASDLLFTHSPEAREYLLSEGCPERSIHYVGNTMIDTLVALRHRVQDQQSALQHGMTAGEYLLVTLHRPALVDGPLLEPVMEELVRLSAEIPVLFPVHPRTRKAIQRMDCVAGAAGLRLVEPQGYLSFLSLLEDAQGVLTDSGGIQEEATYLGVPCLTLRENTERPATVTTGTNMLLGLRPHMVAEVPALLEEIRAKPSRVPPLWDGRAAERIVNVLAAQPLHAGATAAAPAAHRQGHAANELVRATPTPTPPLAAEGV
ncbi:MAG TPA: UDP-N-acetylglucosamine 2-epimerase (non-hydrolyzing) [Thermoleophilaceae bacterium]|nr:UDP-N-acetylglucosamine 2-epimerase (non-hydrolyzing) [Thermoleophilaceae bacterium]